MHTDSHGRKDSEWYFPAKEYTVNNGRKEGEQTATGRPANKSQVEISEILQHKMGTPI